MADLSIIIPSRNEMFLAKTIENILENIEGDTEIIVILDGEWADPPVPIHERVTVVYHNQSVGQRAATNEGVRLSKAKFVMKCDAHVAFDKGFDVKMMKEFEGHEDWTFIPRMYNLHAFDWVCKSKDGGEGCGARTYQGPTPEKCSACGGKMEREMIWKPRLNRCSDSMRFDNTLHFQYWGGYTKREEAKGDIADTMCLLGACFMLTRERYWELNISDEKHGSWGQQGVEVSCKSWLSGGALKVNKKTWFAHMFRTQGGDFGFPYPNPGIGKAREYSRDLWINNKWDKAIHPLSWLIEKFWPVDGWTEEDLINLKNGTFKVGEKVKDTKPVASEQVKSNVSKGIIFYTDNQLGIKIAHKVQHQLGKMKLPIVSASLKPMSFGSNVYLPLKRSYLTMFKQIYAAIEASETEVIFFCEHDVLYHPSHFDFTPAKEDVWYYNENVWKLNAENGHCIHYDCKQVSGIAVYRKTALAHYKKRLEILEEKVKTLNEQDFNRYIRAMGFEPGTHNRNERVDDSKSEAWNSLFPNVDIRHGKNLTSTRWRKDQFRSQRSCPNWQEAEEIPGWGKVKI